MATADFAMSLAFVPGLFRQSPVNMLIENVSKKPHEGKNRSRGKLTGIETVRFKALLYAP